MFASSGKAAVTLTPRAAAQVARLMQGKGAHGLRIGVRKGGCAGMEYTMELAAEPRPHEAVVEQDGARVLIAPMAQMFLIGTEIDYEVTRLSAKFVFRNPNETDACGCGESVTIVPASAEG